MGRRSLGMGGQSTTETLLMMTFLMLLVFGFVHVSMLATTKYLVNYAAFSAARTAMIGGRAASGAYSALMFLRWTPPEVLLLGGPIGGVDGPRTQDATARRKQRQGFFVTYHMPFGLPYNSLPPFGLALTSFSPYAPQPDIKDCGDNASDDC